MSIEKYLTAYQVQKGHAKFRGIEFKLTFKEWCDFWGEDVDRRGSGLDDLVMMRYADSGAYEIGNISKGTPKQNAITTGNMKRKRASDSAKVEVEAALNQAMFESSLEEHDIDAEIDEFEFRRMGIKSSYGFRYHHAT